MASVGDNAPGEIRYADSGGVNVAYRLSGSGPVDAVFIGGWVTHMECAEEDPGIARLHASLRRFARILEFDKRGTGLSDRVPDDALPTIEERMDDIRAAMDAAGLERASIIGFSEGGALAMLFAATYPERTTGLVLCGAYASMVKRDDYEWGLTPDELELSARAYLTRWGTGVGLGTFAPSLRHDPAARKWFARFQRMAASPAAAVALIRMNAEIDVRGALGAISTPTLILHRRDDASSRSATLGTWRSTSPVPGWSSSRGRSLDVGGRPRARGRGDRGVPDGARAGRPSPSGRWRRCCSPTSSARPSAQRSSATPAGESCSSVTTRWSASELARHRRPEIKTVGDGFLATFDGPARGDPLRDARSASERAGSGSTSARESTRGSAS